MFILFLIPTGMAFHTRDSSYPIAISLDVCSMPWLTKVVEILYINSVDGRLSRIIVSELQR